MPPATIAEVVRALAAEGSPDAVLIWSTNLPGFELMAPLEAELGIPVLDSAAVGVAGLLSEAGVPTKALAPLGRVFVIA